MYAFVHLEHGDGTDQERSLITCTFAASNALTHTHPSHRSHTERGGGGGEWAVGRGGGQRFCLKE